MSSCPSSLADVGDIQANMECIQSWRQSIENSDAMGKVENTITGGIEDLIEMAADGGIKEFKGAIPSLMNDGLSLLPNFSGMAALGMDTAYWKHQPMDLLSPGGLVGDVEAKAKKFVKSGEDAVKNIFHHIEPFQPGVLNHASTQKPTKKNKLAVLIIIMSIVIIVCLSTFLN